MQKAVCSPFSENPTRRVKVFIINPPERRAIPMELGFIFLILIAATGYMLVLDKISSNNGNNKHNKK